MKIETMFRHFKEAFKSLVRNNWMTFAAVSAVSVTLLIFGIFLVFAFNINYMASELDKQVSIRASLNAQIDADQIDQIQAQLKKNPQVKEVNFVSKQQGLQMMKEQWGDDKEFLEGLEKDNPLPDILEIQAKDPQQTEALAKEIRKSYPNQVDQVDHGEGVSDRLLNLSAWVRNMVLVFGLGLAVLAAFLISNTIKLTIFARRREIEIMRLVGASNWFIRWPFFIEGAVIGMLGAIVPVTVVLLGYNAVVSILDADKAYSFFKLLGMWPLSLYVAGLTTMLGILIGVWGSLISIRRFLRT
ncbi:cell division transport system permease protein [Melghirimyces profundicolus]|uniref:Cell division protein FtsX n=1 Tax=Melghirimyces profundicolus TaxID=1242148 RepID=A0A2T6BUD0_9BACL|nr:permease-like cell division protein FtsX [Melghirimyces profundicolus]PTX59672.1 cell division transport system permease protein [Melghirimyces profundicolus]